ncbi:response regulator [Paenibacillus thermoaerophilus]|uniref:Response regulator n=1 Tax=Paenibacillus thermoaerophilus TaxID=1215385 RepID=A0ABW2UYN6_9BACL|nr:response regulator [Paenibacillus thermoaerophilus]TMV16079.1 response regulator transcription factor [Paenibacillus thermoaerophilus]
MNKVLLVDDEVFVRKGLRNLIDWPSLGYEVAAEADNGEEALAAIESEKPDLVVTDIRMPVLDGLDLIRTVTERQKSTPTFIIVSGYHEFKYAQQALRYGVHDYILKPIDENELTATLKKLCGRLRLRKWTRSGKAGEGSVPVLDLLAQEDIAPEDEPEFAAALGMEQSYRFVYILAEYADASAGDVLTALGLPYHESLPGHFGVLADSAKLAGFGGSIESFLGELQSKLPARPGCSVALYAGRCVERIGSVKESALTALEASQYKYAYDGEPYILYDHVRDKPLNHLHVDSQLHARLLEQIEENNRAACESTIGEMFREFQTRILAPKAVASALSRCVIGIVRVIREMGGDECRLPSLHATIEGMQPNQGLKALKEMFSQFVIEAAEYVALLRQEQAKSGIHQIRKYIEQHFTENISLKSISAKFYMNPVYLGQLFKKTYNIYFNEFVLDLRIQEAKKLLRQTDLRMYEVAQKVGFQNADYFVTQFEKLEKMTPTEYRNKLLGNK